MVYQNTEYMPITVQSTTLEWARVEYKRLIKSHLLVTYLFVSDK